MHQKAEELATLYKSPLKSNSISFNIFNYGFLSGFFKSLFYLD